MFTLGAEEYGIDILKVQEIRGYDAVTRIANAPEFIKGVVNLRGHIVPIVDLRLKFGLGEPVYNEFTVVIVLNVFGRVIGAVVDGVSDVIQLEREALRAAPEFGAAVDTAYIEGLGTLDDRMIIVVDIERLMGSEEMALTDAADRAGPSVADVFEGRRMNNMKVMHRLALGFGLLILLLAVAMTLAVRQLQVAGDLVGISSVHIPQVSVAHKLAANVNLTSRDVRNLLLSKDPQLIKEFNQEIDNNLAKLTQRMAQLEPNVSSAGRPLFEGMRADEANFRSELAVFRRMQAQGREVQARDYLFVTLRDTQLKYMDSIDRYIAFEEGLMRKAGQDASDNSQQAYRLMFVFTLLALAIGVGFGVFIIRSLMRQLGGEPAELVKVMRELTEGQVRSGNQGQAGRQAQPVRVDEPAGGEGDREHPGTQCAGQRFHQCDDRRQRTQHHLHQSQRHGNAASRRGRYAQGAAEFRRAHAAGHQYGCVP